MPTPTDETLLVELAEELRSERTVISEHVVEPAQRPCLGAVALALAPDRRLLAAVIETVREGYLLHYGTPRMIDPPDPDLALLAGDYLYARALGSLASAGELGAINELADLISLSAQIHEAGQEPGPASDRLWFASAVAIAVGTDPQHASAKEQLRVDGESEQLYRWALAAAERLGAGGAVAEIGETVGLRPSDG